MYSERDNARQDGARQGGPTQEMAARSFKSLKLLTQAGNLKSEDFQLPNFTGRGCRRDMVMDFISTTRFEVSGFWAQMIEIYSERGHGKKGLDKRDLVKTEKYMHLSQLNYRLILEIGNS